MSLAEEEEKSYYVCIGVLYYISLFIIFSFLGVRRIWAEAEEKRQHCIYIHTYCLVLYVHAHISRKKEKEKKPGTFLGGDKNTWDAIPAFLSFFLLGSFFFYIARTHAECH